MLISSYNIAFYRIYLFIIRSYKQLDSQVCVSVHVQVSSWFRLTIMNQNIDGFIKKITSRSIHVCMCYLYTPQGGGLPFGHPPVWG